MSLGVNLGPRVLAPAATGAAEFFSSNGGDPDRVFGETGIDPDSTVDPTLDLGLINYCRLFEQAARWTQNDNIGLWFGQQFKPRQLGMLGYVAIHSPTLKSGLRNLVDMFPYHQQATLMQLSDVDASKNSDGLLKLEYQINDGRIVAQRQDAELSLGMFVNIFRHCLGYGWAPEEIHFEHPTPESPKEHERAFNAPVYFSQPTNAIVFKRDVLDSPMPGHDLRLLGILLSCLTQLGSGDIAEPGIVDRVRGLLRSQLADGYQTLDEIADELQLPVWTLQRRLADDGLTYKELVESTRRDLAFMYLRQSHIPISEIAFLLGYSELSAFSRAFHRWTGAAPMTWRRQALMQTRN